VTNNEKCFCLDFGEENNWKSISQDDQMDLKHY
jgi:hypothetical protein